MIIRKNKSRTFLRVKPVQKGNSISKKPTPLVCYSKKVRDKAFLLIEVLVTVIIVSVAIILINHAFSSSLKATALSNDYLHAVLLLEDKGFDLELNPKAEEGKSSEEEQFGRIKFYWEQIVSPLEKEELGDEYEEEGLGLKRLTLSLRWKRRGVERDIELLTYTQSIESEE